MPASTKQSSATRLTPLEALLELTHAAQEFFDQRDIDAQFSGAGTRLQSRIEAAELTLCEHGVIDHEDLPGVSSSVLSSKNDGEAS